MDAEQRRVPRYRTCCRDLLQINGGLGHSPSIRDELRPPASALQTRCERAKLPAAKPRIYFVELLSAPRCSRVPSWTDVRSRGGAQGCNSPGSQRGDSGDKGTAGTSGGDAREPSQSQVHRPQPGQHEARCCLPIAAQSHTHRQHLGTRSCLCPVPFLAVGWNRGPVCKDTWLVSPGGDQTHFSAKMRQKQWENQRGLVGRGLHCHLWEIKVSAPTSNALLLCPRGVQTQPGDGARGARGGEPLAASLAHHRFAPTARSANRFLTLFTQRATPRW